MSKYFILTILIVLLVGLILPQLVSAALVPCGRECVRWSEDGKTCLEAGKNPDGTPIPLEEAQPCNLCHIFEMLQTIIQGAMLAILAWAGLFILIGGIILLTSAGSAEQASKGKRTITYAIIGIVVAFGSWLLINTIMNALVNPDVLPWKAWNKITCEPSEPIVTDGEENGEENGEEEGEYCVCEAPVYDLDPDQYPAQASRIGTNIKVSKLNNAEECQNNCISENAGSYCPSTPNQEAVNLYCVDEASAKSKTTCAIRLSRDPPCHISKGQCWSDALQCAATVTPGTPQFNSAYARRCFLNGQSLCSYIEWSNGATYCPNKSNGPCTSDKPYTLYRFAEEHPREQLDALTCSERYYANTDYVCRLDCEYDKCKEEQVERCDELNPPLGQTKPCLGGSYTCQQGVIDQYSDACKELKDLLACMAGKNMPAAAKEISSISDNSPPLAGSLPGCFREWKSICGSTEDSCSGTCCGHSKCSLHYGGKASTPNLGPTDCPGIGTIDCRQCSWAVDFANENYYDIIKNSAQTCGKELWEGNLERIDVVLEGNHVHVELDGVAAYHRCK